MNPQNQTSTLGSVAPRLLEEEMKTSYLDYAMSVIVARALPDVRDGLKPVQRRILWAMWKLGLKPGARFRKSATVVGEVLGKYHPHGDVAVYDALVRMAQDFSMREPLVIGQGNFGSVDGDAAAAMRYTEVKLSHLAEELLVDIEKETVTFRPNYDGTQEEPTVLPGKFPNLLANGSVGIAVGMATSIPPHNLGEIAASLIYLADHPNATMEELVERLPGPDFPSGGLIYNREDIRLAYATGKGGITMRARAEIREEKGETRIIVTELPYQVNKSQLLERIADLVREKRIEGIRDIRDESDKEGIRIVVVLRRDAYPKKVLNRLFAATSLQETFHVNMLALVGGIQPRILTLKEVLDAYLAHREEVVKKRSEFDLRAARDRAHVLEGLKKALAHLDAVIATIKRSEDREDAKKNLIKRFRFSERQADAILDMRLAQLAHLEREKITEELKITLARIAELLDILSSRKKILGVVKGEVAELAKRYSSPRRTEIVPHPVGEFRPEDLIPNAPAVIMITRDGYVKRLEPSSFRRQSRGGKGVIGLTTKEEDEVSHLFSTTTHAQLLFFTTKGRVFQLPAYEVPVSSRGARGQSLANFLELPSQEKVSVVFPSSAAEDHTYVVMVTAGGVIKKVERSSVTNVRRSGLIALSLKGNDQLRWVRPSSGKDDLLLVTRKGKSVRFAERQLRPMGRQARGVRGIRLAKGDAVVGMDVVAEGKDASFEVLVVTEQGLGKRTPLSEYRRQGRGGSGIKTAQLTAKTGSLAAAFLVRGKEAKGDLVIISLKGQVIRLPLASVRVAGRATQGVRLMRFKEGRDKVASVTLL